MSKKTKNIRIGYQMAIEMWAHCGDEVWSRFNSMLVAHSIIVYAGISALLENPPFKNLIYILSVAGIVICFLWAIMMERAFAYQDYYLFTARDWEESASGELAPIKTISVGRDFRHVGKNSDIKEGCFDCISKWFLHINAKRASIYVIVVFEVLYIFLFIFGILK